jgi:DHA2 family multidrug resistance protein
VAQETNDNYKWKVLGVVMVGTLMSALDSSIVNVSIPKIMADFGCSLDDIEWVITAYMLAFASLMPLTAWLRDRMGHKSLYLGSLAVFTAGSVLCGLAWNLPMLIGARVIQAAGGGAITPTGMAMITESFEPHERGRALGFWGMGAVMGPAFGPTLGGYLTTWFGWPSIFLVNLPIGIAGIYFGLRILRADRPHAGAGKRFDAFGFTMLAIFLVGFLLGMSKGEAEGWTSTYVVTCFIAAFFGFVGFLTVETQINYAIMDLKLLKSPVFAACFSLTGVRSIALYGGTFLLPVFLQNYKGLDEIESGLVLLPGSLLMGVLMPFAGRLGDKMSPRILGFVGFAMLGWFFFEYRHLDVTTSMWGVVWPTLIRGVGIAMLMAPLTATAMNAIPKTSAGMGSSMLNICQQVGGSIGIAVLGLMLQRRSAYHLSLAGSAVDANSPAFRDALGNFYRVAHDAGLSHAESVKAASSIVGRHVADFATVQGFQDAFLIGAMITFATLFLVFLLPNHPQARGPNAEPIHME